MTLSTEPIPAPTEAEQQLIHLANALPLLAGLTRETRADLLELTGEFAHSYGHPAADRPNVSIDFLGAALQVMRGPLLPPCAAFAGGEV